MAREFMQALPHARALGMHLAEMGQGRATVTMDYDPRFIGDPATGVLHGGAISAGRLRTTPCALTAKISRNPAAISCG